MNTRVAERIIKINPSQTLAISAKAKKLKSQGRGIVNFAAGEPDFDTPGFIKDAAIEAIRRGFTKYTPTTGTEELKKLIRAKFQKDNSLNYELNQIIVSCGAKHSIFNALFALINLGDEVIIPSPYWLSYPEMVSLCQGSCCFIETNPENNFKITAQQLKSAINSRTKALILNSPSNPTGCVYSEDELRQIADICVKNKIFVISDEIYEKLTYDNTGHTSIAAFNKDIYNLTITVNGLSKSHSMTGWRIGYLGCPADIAEGISKLQDHSTSNPSSISQKAAEAALNARDDNFCRDMKDEFQKRRDYLASRLLKIKEINFVLPKGAFYVFCDIAKTGINASDLANRLLDEALVAVIPGEGFGKNDHIRISFAANMDELKKGMDRIESWIKKYDA